ncbi:hypothetical protein DUHN55_35880 [Helicobacter pylori]
MTRTVLQPSDEELAARLLAELNAMPPSIDVEATVTGARRHRRRAVVATAGTVAGGVAIVAGVVGLGLANMPRSDWPVAPAAPATMSGCTLAPATCDPDVIDAWVDEKVVGGTTTVHIGEYGPSPTGDGEGTTMGAYESLVTVYRDRSGSKPPEIVGEITVSVSTSVQADRLVALNENEGTLTERESTWQVGDEEVTARVLDIDRGLQTEGDIDQLWIVEEDQSHGALIVWASGFKGAGRFVPSDGSGPGVTDASVQDLITRLLTEPPEQG